jgi:hypothetical protein
MGCAWATTGTAKYNGGFVNTKFEQHYRYSPGFDRRSFLGALGAGALTLGGSGFLGVGEVLAQDRRDGRSSRRFFLSEENFGRMFERLPAFFGDRPPRGLNEALLEIGKLGGVLDANDRLPARSTTRGPAKRSGAK